MNIQELSRHFFHNIFLDQRLMQQSSHINMLNAPLQCECINIKRKVNPVWKIMGVFMVYCEWRRINRGSTDLQSALFVMMIVFGSGLKGTRRVDTVHFSLRFVGTFLRVTSDGKITTKSAKRHKKRFIPSSDWHVNGASWTGGPTSSNAEPSPHRATD